MPSWDALLWKAANALEHAPVMKSLEKDTQIPSTGLLALSGNRIYNTTAAAAGVL